MESSSARDDLIYTAFVKVIVANLLSMQMKWIQL